MKKNQLIIIYLIVVLLLTGLLGFGHPVAEAQPLGSLPFSNDLKLPIENVAWNKGLAWVEGGGMVLPNVAWNKGVAWYDAGGLFLPNVAWNKGAA